MVGLLLRCSWTLSGMVIAYSRVMIESTHKLTPTSLVSSSTSKALPKSFPVSVVMESRPSSSQWVDVTWKAIGLAVHNNGDGGSNRSIKVIDQGDVKQFIYSGLNIRLFFDECESYYHNLMSPEPGCFVVAREEDEEGNDSDIPIPFLVTLSFDEAHAYLEGDDTVYSVPIPPELYRWTEAYILENYSAEKRKKRKRVNWKKQEKQQGRNRGGNDALK